MIVGGVDSSLITRMKHLDICQVAVRDRVYLGSLTWDNVYIKDRVPSQLLLDDDHVLVHGPSISF
jgi:hypothetical protein